MCLRRPDSVFLPIIAILILVTAVASAVDSGKKGKQEAKVPFLTRLSDLTSKLRPEPPVAPLDEPYQPVGDLTYVDLSENVNKKLSDGTVQIRGNTLAEVAPGEYPLAGVKFKIIDGVMQLTSKRREHFPKSIDGISVNNTFSRIYFFHATQGSGDLADGTLIGKYVVNFEDETYATIPIVVGEDVRDWWNFDRSKKLTRGRVAWVGSNRGARSHGRSLRLFVSQWENPRPDATVASIDYVSENRSEAGPFCLAITLESATGSAATAELPAELPAESTAESVDAL